MTEDQHIARAAAALDDPGVTREAAAPRAAAPQPAANNLRNEISNLCVWSGKAHDEQQLVDLEHVLAIIDAAPQPAPVDREALVKVIRTAVRKWSCDDNDPRCSSVEVIVDALLAAGLRLPGGGARNRVEYDEAGKLDEVVTDAGMHLERMSDKGWFLSGQRSDGSEIAIWFKGKVALVEERPAP